MPSRDDSLSSDDRGTYASSDETNTKASSIDLFLLHFVADSTDKCDSDELIKIRTKLKPKIEERVKNILGDEFKVNNIIVRNGSVEIFIIIGSISGVSWAIYDAISKYPDFKNGVKQLSDDLRTLFRSFFGVKIYAKPPRFFIARNARIEVLLEYLIIILSVLSLLLIGILVFLFQHYYM